jgi:ubiquitin carboxyl-terminal hydrolase 2/21
MTTGWRPPNAGHLLPTVRGDVFATKPAADYSAAAYNRPVGSGSPMVLPVRASATIRRASNVVAYPLTTTYAKPPDGKVDGDAVSSLLQPPPPSPPARAPRPPPMLTAATISRHTATVPSSDVSPAPVAVLAELGPGLTGLRNLGNTCFLNAVVQCLRHDPGLVAWAHTGPSLRTDRLEPVFRHLINALWAGGQSCVAPTAFKNAIGRLQSRFIGYEQQVFLLKISIFGGCIVFVPTWLCQDAHEFLQYLLDALNDEETLALGPKRQPQLESSPGTSQRSLGDNAAAKAWASYRQRNPGALAARYCGLLRSTLTCTVCGHVSVTFDPSWGLALPVVSGKSGVLLSDCLAAFFVPEV